MQLTALQIIQQAALELGLNKPNEVAASLENTGQQMLALLNAAGADLMFMHPWQEITAIHVFQTNAAQAAYAFPSDMNYIVDGTFWNRTNDEPLIGPVTSQEWAALTSGADSLTPHEVFRFLGGSVLIFPTPTAVLDIAFEYVSANWVESGLNIGTYKSTITADTDIPRLNSNLLIKALKVKMWNAKGLDTTALLAEFNLVFESLLGKNKGARVLSLAARASSGYLSMRNVQNGSWN